MNQEHDDTTQIDETPAEPQALPTDKADVSVDPQRAKKIVDCHMSEWKRECIKRDAERQEIWDAGQAARDKAAALRLQPPDDLFQAP